MDSTDLTRVIGAATTVTNRLNFIQALRKILADDHLRKNLREVDQLHLMVNKNLWCSARTDRRTTAVRRPVPAADDGEAAADPPAARSARSTSSATPSPSSLSMKQPDCSQTNCPAASTITGQPALPKQPLTWTYLRVRSTLRLFDQASGSPPREGAK
ncbi:hypothetical protein P9869_41485 [Streptomyces ossamyceticus]|nr:hypothetical protein [Streptomyces ossamyceticus]